MMSILSLIDTENTVQKVVTRVSCGAQLSHVHQLTTVMPIPPPKVILTIPDNKLIGLIVDNLCRNTVFP